MRRKIIGLLTSAIMLCSAIPALPASAAEASGTVNQPYQINNVSDFQAAMTNLDAENVYFEVNSDLTDLNGIQRDTINGNWDFKGHNVTSDSLLCTTNSGVIKNMNYTPVSELSTSAVCRINNGTIENCRVTGTINNTESGARIGGIASTNNGTISECAFEGKIQTINDSIWSVEIGGIVGYDKGEIINCNADCDLKSSYDGDTGGTVYMGGIAGYRDSNKEIKYCWSKGTLYATSKYGDLMVGGIVGYVTKGDTNNCYSRCRVDGAPRSGDQFCFGGIIGKNGSYNGNNGGKVAYCYHSGYLYKSTSGTTSCGEICGQTGNGQLIKIANCGISEIGSFDYDTIWNVNESINDGLPYINLREKVNPIEAAITGSDGVYSITSDVDADGESAEIEAGATIDMTGKVLNGTLISSDPKENITVNLVNNGVTTTVMATSVQFDENGLVKDVPEGAVISTPNGKTGEDDKALYDKGYCVARQLESASDVVFTLNGKAFTAELNGIMDGSVKFNIFITDIPEGASVTIE